MKTHTPMESTARDLARRLREQGHKAYFAGGCVRDFLRGQAPKDIDIATDARPEAVQKIFPRTYAVGAHFGVIVVLENGFQFEVATFRSDGAYLDGRRPAEGAFRDSRGRRGAARFHDQRDVLRSGGGGGDRFRRRPGGSGEASRSARSAIRRSALPRIGCECCARCVSRPCWSSKSSPRPGTRSWRRRLRSARSARSESAKSWCAFFCRPQRVRGWDLLDASGLMRAVLPELEAMKGCEQPPQFHPGRRRLQAHAHHAGAAAGGGVAAAGFQRAFSRYRQAADFSVDEDGRIRFNGHDRVGAEMTEAIMERLRFSRAEIDATVEAVRQHMVFKDVPEHAGGEAEALHGAADFRG